MSHPLSDQLIAFGDKRPVLGPRTFVAAGARLVGEVTLGEGASVWFNTVLRGDIAPVVIGPFTNIQDNSTCHVASGIACIVGAYCTVGHRVTLHACAIGDETLVGMGAVVMDGCVVGNQCIIGANALLTKGLRAPDGSLVYGAPAKVVSTLGATERGKLRASAEKYARLAQAYQSAGPPPERP
ncbi:MAG: gamma carbonic anhydrase family protein [Verrucomicrobia bacterium]|nr:gamma carbonic anhydrase family protein [Verrucomicrobiota bacterium]